MLKINNIYQSDVFDFLNKLDDNSIDLAIIDPPYNIKIDSWDEFLNFDTYMKFTKKWIDLTLKKLKQNSSLYMFNNSFNSAIIVNYLTSKDIDFKNWIIWYKKDGFGPSKRKYVNNQETILYYTKGKNYTFNADDIRVPYSSRDRINAAKKKGILKNGKRWYPNSKGKLCSDVWEISSNRHKNKINGKLVKSIHPTPKPEDLIERIVKASSNKGDVILDLFSGTGTTSYIAKKFDRDFVGCEINQEYIVFINDRLKILEG